MNPKTYVRWIGQPFYNELAGLLEQGRHIALLGPRNSGKSLVLKAVTDLAQSWPAPRQPMVVPLHYRDFDGQDNAGFARTIAGKLQVRIGRAPADMLLSGRLADIMQRALRASQQTIWFFVYDILGFSVPKVRELLLAFQHCHGDARLRDRMGVLVTGSADFIPLTYSERSPYHHARKYLIYGMDNETALDFFCRRRAGKCSPLPQESNQLPAAERRDIDPDAFEYLYQQTGGQAHFIQEIVVSVMRHPLVLPAVVLAGCWNRKQVQSLIDAFVNEHMPHDHFSRMVLREVERDIKSYDLLLNVLKGKKPVEVRALTPLEVQGFIRRDATGKATISCPVWQTFLHRSLTRQRIADEHACQNRWELAWEEYGAIPPAQRDRPVSGDARFRLRSLLRVWSDSLWNLVPQGPEAVCKQFYCGARYILGFDAGGAYDLGTVPLVPPQPPAPLHRNVNCLEPCDVKCPPPGNKPVYKDASGHTYWLDGPRLKPYSEAKLGKSPIPPRRLCLYMVRREISREIDSAEQEYLWSALHGFWQAYEAALEFELGELRERHLKVIEHVSSQLVNEPFDMGKVVQQTADALVSIGGYRRIQICLVDPRRERIQCQRARKTGQ